MGQISAFCPLSLLSGDVEIVARNLHHLLEAKQSNFKIFHQCRQLSTEGYGAIKASQLRSLAAIIVKHARLFQKISVLQRMDRFDITAVHAMWTELKRRKKLSLIEQTLHDK